MPLVIVVAGVADVEVEVLVEAGFVVGVVVVVVDGVLVLVWPFVFVVSGVVVVNVGVGVEAGFVFGVVVEVVVGVVCLVVVVSLVLVSEAGVWQSVFSSAGEAWPSCLRAKIRRSGLWSS